MRTRSAIRSLVFAVTAICGVVAALLGGPASAGTGRADVVVAGLLTEAQPQPLGIDVARPRLSWLLESQRRGVRQSAYRVRVASTPALAADGAGDVWDSRRVSTDVPWVDYAGRKLAARTRYFWTVQVWDERGRSTPRSKPAWFETAFTDPGQWSASWIAGPPVPADCADERQCSPAPLLREEFVVDGPVAAARLYASGLGYGTYYLNGKRLSNAVLSPGFTEYTERALYTTTDLRGRLRQGRNAIGAVLGRGPFGSVGSNFAGYANAPWHADPQLRLELHIRYRDGRQHVVRSGPGWTATDGPIRFDDYMLGETYDARRAEALDGWAEPGFDDSDWVPAVAASGPAGRLEAQVEEPIRPQQAIQFKSVTQTESGTWRFDLGQNVTGNAVLDTDLPEGTTITLHYGEKLLDNGSVDTAGGSFDGKPMQLDTYTAGTGRDVWRPEFTFKGFQYVEVAGLDEEPDPSMLTAQVWHTDFPRIGSWTSSHDLVNRIYGASRRAIVSNSLSIPMDTPIYEKTGYTADGQLVAGATSYLFDTRRYYAKWLTDIRQSVAPNGDMGISAPLPSDPPEQQGPNGIVYTTPGWDAALMVVPDVLKQFHGDARPGVAALPEMQRVWDYYETRTRNDILPAACTVAFQQVCHDGLGDWTAPTGSSYGAAVDSTAWYAWMLRQLSAFATDAGNEDLAAAAAARSDAVAAAFHRTFFDPATGAYRDFLNPEPGEPGRQSNGVFFSGEPLRPPPAEVATPGTDPSYSQHQNALPLGLDVVPADQRQAVGDTLAADVRARGGHLSTGIMGTRFLFEALARTGHVDEAFAVLTQTSYPSYGYWLDTLGYTSLAEFWEGNQRSLNHQMYGSVVQWLYEGLAGIRPTKPGFAEIEVRPEIPTEGLNDVRAYTNTVRGRVESGWHKTADGLRLNVTVPANATAIVHVPASDPDDVSETGTGRTLSAGSAPGVTLLRTESGRVVYRVESGRYRFEVTQG